MLSILPARSDEDFKDASKLCRRLAQWDAEAVQPYGVTAEEVMAIFHPFTSGPQLAATFGSVDAMMFVARLDRRPVGCLAFDAFDDEAVELHRFFVDASFRRRGVGRALMQVVLAEIGKSRRGRVYVHTTFYMTQAIAVYEAFGFGTCPRFRETPECVRFTDVFMSRSRPLQEV